MSMLRGGRQLRLPVCTRVGGDAWATVSADATNAEMQADMRKGQLSMQRNEGRVDVTVQTLFGHDQGPDGPDTVSQF